MKIMDEPGQARKRRLDAMTHDFCFGAKHCRLL